MGSASYPLIQRVAEKCQEFTNSWHDNVLKELTNVVTQVKSSDLNFNVNNYQFDNKTPTLQVMPIYFDFDMTITLYVLKGNALVPIHDHPGMYSLVRVLEGKLQIAGYSKTASPELNAGRTIHVKPGTLRVVGNSERANVTTPTTDNFHSLRAVGGPAAYLDILVPPFEPGIRDRNQYEVANPLRGLDEAEHMTLKKIDSAPVTVKEIEYQGPKVRLHEVRNGRPDNKSVGRPTSVGRAVSMGRTGGGNYRNGQNVEGSGRVYTVVCPTCSTEIAWRPI